MNSETQRKKKQNNKNRPFGRFLIFCHPGVGRGPLLRSNNHYLPAAQWIPTCVGMTMTIPSLRAIPSTIEGDFGMIPEKKSPSLDEGVDCEQSEQDGVEKKHRHRRWSFIVSRCPKLWS